MSVEEHGFNRDDIEEQLHRLEATGMWNGRSPGSLRRAS